MCITWTQIALYTVEWETRDSYSWWEHSNLFKNPHSIETKQDLKMFPLNNKELTST